MELLQHLFTSESFMPHGYCYLWQPELVGLHVTSDALVALSYYTIPATLVYFVQKRKDLPFDWVFLLFGAFIILCGSTHVMEIWTLWHANYWQAGLLKAFTALVSVVTAITLIPLVPKALALPSPAQLEAANQALQTEITERKRAELEVRTLNVELEERVKARTQELLDTNLQLKAEISQREKAELALQTANDELEIRVTERTTELRQTVEQLQQEIQERQRAEENIRSMQKQIIVQEKLASLGSLTAGIAHEIRNPLNFVNNFADLSVELTEEILSEFETQKNRLEESETEYFTEVLSDLRQNVHKIKEHGNRAERTVSNMLLHARGEKGEWAVTDINNLLTEAVNLAYHGMRGNDPLFNVNIKTNYDNTIQKVNVVPQELNRALINIISNACYAANEKKKVMENKFAAAIYVETKNLLKWVEITIQDNGKGIPEQVLEKIFHPFFTTKPTGEGTGLGLSMAHDIIVQQHRGDIKVETLLGEYTKFIIILPKQASLEESTEEN